MKLSEAFEEFLLDRIASGATDKTIADYRQKIRIFRTYAKEDLPVEQIDLNFCRLYYVYLRDRGISSVTIQAYIRNLRAFLNWLYLNDYIKADICHRFRLPKAQRKYIDILTDEEIRKIFDALSGDRWVDARNRVIIMLMLDCGLRLNEVVTARLEYLHLREKYIIVDGKGQKQRAVPFGRTLEISIRQYLDQTTDFETLIISGCRDGRQKRPPEPVTYEAVKDLFRILKEKTGIARLHPHLLRHTFATRYLENGGNIYALQMILGHTQLTMCQKYLHLAQSKVVSGFINFSPVDRLQEEGSETP